MAEARIALHVLTAGLVLDRSVFVGQTVEEIKATVAALRASANSKKTVTVIEGAMTFFNSANMLALIKASDDSYKLIAEKAGVTLRDEDIQAIVAAEAAKQAIEAAMIPPIPPYPFAIIPTGWSIATDLAIGTGARAGVRRRRTNPTGNGTTYTLSMVQLKRIWAIAGVRWMTKTSNRHLSGINCDGYTRSATVGEQSIEVGCQTVQRYELEQLALHLNWEFPQPK